MNIVAAQEARKLGLLRYFTGEPCKRGHVVERLTSTRACLSCKLMHKLRWQKDNAEKHETYNRAKALQWREENRERHRAKSREIYWRNPEKAREREKERWKSDPETRKRHKLRMSMPLARAKAVANARRFAKEHPEIARERVRDWVRRHPEKRGEYSRNRRAREMNAKGSHTAKDITDIFRLQRGTCAYCRISLKSARQHVDHIIPLSGGGSNERSNLQILCQQCNLSKNAHDPIVFAQSLGRLL